MCERVLSESTAMHSWQGEKDPSVSVWSGQGPRLRLRLLLHFLHLPSLSLFCFPPDRRLFVFPCFSTSLSPLPRPLFGTSLRPSVCAPTTWVSPRRRWFPRFAPILQLTQTRANGEDGERVRSGRSLPRHAETDSRRYFETCSLGRPQCKKKRPNFSFSFFDGKLKKQEAGLVLASC